MREFRPPEEKPKFETYAAVVQRSCGSSPKNGYNGASTHQVGRSVRVGGVTGVIRKVTKFT